jgi:hypothetical protein
MREEEERRLQGVEAGRMDLERGRRGWRRRTGAA